MGKKDKFRLRFKNSIFRLTAGITGLILEFNIVGGAQDLLNHKEIKSYYEVIDDFQEFLEDQGVEDPTLIFDYFNYALWNGYLSENHSFGYSDKRDIFFDNYGVGNISGQGVCLNNAGMLKDLYEAYGYESSLILCYVPVGKVSVDASVRSNDEIKRSVDTNKLMQALYKLVKPLALFIGNHAVTVVEYNGEYYYFDPTNLAYLAKSDIDDLEIINGDGSFKRRYFMNFIFELDDSFMNMFGKTNQEYVEFFDDMEKIEIDIDALEEFYQKEKDTINEIARGMNKKPQMLLLMLFIIMAGLCRSNIFKKVEEMVFGDAKSNEIVLKFYLHDFFIFNNIKNFEDICSYLHYLINKGYLSYNVDNLVIKKRLCVYTPSLVTVDYKRFGEDFFDLYMMDEKSVVGFDDDKNAKTFYMQKKDDRYIFYSYEDNSFYHLNEDGELVNGDKKYKLLRLFREKIKDNNIVDEDIKPCIDEELCNKFYEDNKERIKVMAKRYAYEKDERKTSK